jgi:hypothetical protein
MSRRPIASFWHRRVIAGAAHMLALCCIPIFTLVLVMNNTTPPPPENHSHAPSEHV